MRNKDLSLARDSDMSLELALEEYQDEYLEEQPKLTPIEEAAKQIAFLAPLDVSTILFEYDDLVPKPEDCFVVPMNVDPVAMRSKGLLISNDSLVTDEYSAANPLDSFLGYSMDDSPTKQQDNEVDEMDKQWANFIEELESSGLLHEEDEEVEPARTGPEIPYQPNKDQDESDQKVVGEVPGCPGWHQVLDGETGTYYYWNSSTNEVRWEPPEDMEPEEPKGNEHLTKSEDSDLTDVPDEDLAAELEDSLNHIGNNTGHVRHNDEGSVDTGPEPSQENTTDMDIEECLATTLEPIEETNVPSTPPNQESESVEEGELKEVMAHGLKESQSLWDKVSSTVKSAKQGIGEWYNAIPEAVKLAIIAEAHLDHWMFMTSQLHQSSTTEGDQLKDFWQRYETYMDDAIDWVSESLPTALAHLSYSSEASDGMAPTQHAMAPVTDYQWDCLGATCDWSNYSSVTGSNLQLPPLPTEPLPPLPQGSEEIPPPPPGTDDASEEDADVTMDICDSELVDPEEGTGASVDKLATSTSTVKDDSTKMQSAEKQNQDITTNGNYASELSPNSSPVSPDISHSKEKHHSGSLSGSDRKRKLEKGPVAGLLSKKKKVNKVSKSMSKLMNKWQAVKQEEEERMNENDCFNLEALKKRRIADIEEWKQNQLRSGDAENNANFQPLKGDWRSMIMKRDGRKQCREQALSAVDDCLKELPEGWKALVDEDSGETYYGNVNTLETTWARPTS